MAFDMSFLQDPNFLQGMGRAGDAFSRGEPAGVALNPDALIRQIQMQKAGADQGTMMREMLKKMLAGNSGGGEGLGSLATPTSSNNINPTPRGTAGPDAVTTKRTADGTTTTVVEPSPENLSSFGTSTPPEAVKATPNKGGTGTSPFFKALFG